MQSETAGTDCTLPYQSGEGLFSGTGGEQESQSVDKQRGVRNAKNASTVCCEAMFFKIDVS